MNIPGIASAEESALLAQLAEIRKAGGADGDSPQTAAVHALDRLARQRMAADGKDFATSYDAVLRTPEGSSLYTVSKGLAQVTDPAVALAAIRKIGA